MNRPKTAGALRVLLVDDSVPLRQRIRSLIEESLPVEIVGEAGSVIDGLALFRLHKPDAVVLDLSLPDGDGRIVLTEIKSGHPGCVVIVLTSFVGEVFREFCVKAGANYFFDKAREFERVPEVLRKMRPPAGRGPS